MIINNPAINKI